MGASLFTGTLVWEVWSVYTLIGESILSWESLYCDRPVGHRLLHGIIDGVAACRINRVSEEHDTRKTRDHHLNALKGHTVNHEEVQNIAQLVNDIYTTETHHLTVHRAARINVDKLIRVLRRLADGDAIVLGGVIPITDDTQEGSRIRR